MRQHHRRLSRSRRLSVPRSGRRQAGRQARVVLGLPGVRAHRDFLRVAQVDDFQLFGFVHGDLSIDDENGNRCRQNRRQRVQSRKVGRRRQAVGALMRGVRSFRAKSARCSSRMARQSGPARLRRKQHLWRSAEVCSRGCEANSSSHSVSYARSGARLFSNRMNQCGVPRGPTGDAILG